MLSRKSVILLRKTDCSAVFNLRSLSSGEKNEIHIASKHSPSSRRRYQHCTGENSRVGLMNIDDADDLRRTFVAVAFSQACGVDLWRVGVGVSGVWRVPDPGFCSRSRDRRFAGMWQFVAACDMWQFQTLHGHTTVATSSPRRQLWSHNMLRSRKDYDQKSCCVAACMLCGHDSSNTTFRPCCKHDCSVSTAYVVWTQDMHVCNGACVVL